MLVRWSQRRQKLKTEVDTRDNQNHDSLSRFVGRASEKQLTVLCVCVCVCVCVTVPVKVNKWMFFVLGW